MESVTIAEYKLLESSVVLISESRTHEVAVQDFARPNATEAAQLGCMCNEIEETERRVDYLERFCVEPHP